MARQYKRDARGRFASGGGNGRVTGGSLKARTAASRARRKLAGMDPADQSVRGTNSRRAQKGAVTRTKKAMTAAVNASKVRMKGAPSGVVGRGGKVRGKGPDLGMSRARPGQVNRALARATANAERLREPAMRGNEWRTKAGVGYAIAQGAKDYYTGKISRKKKATFSPLTSTDHSNAGMNGRPSMRQLKSRTRRKR